MKATPRNDNAANIHTPARGGVQLRVNEYRVRLLLLCYQAAVCC